MSEKILNLDDLMKKINEFEGTVKALLDNIKKFKTRLIENKEKYGPDTEKWPITPPEAGK
jgi:hypothetical protein